MLEYCFCCYRDIGSVLGQWWSCGLRVARSAAAATLHADMRAAFCCVRGDKGFVATPPDT